VFASRDQCSYPGLVVSGVGVGVDVDIGPAAVVDVGVGVGAGAGEGASRGMAPEVRPRACDRKCGEERGARG
jgi:hypothetical protein